MTKQYGTDANLFAPDADMTQLITVTTAGTPVQGPAKQNPGGWVLTPTPTNTGYVYVMYHGQTKATKGYPMGAGQQTPLDIYDLSSVDFDSDNNGSTILAMKI